MFAKASLVAASCSLPRRDHPSDAEHPGGDNESQQPVLADVALISKIDIVRIIDIVDSTAFI